MDSTNIKSDLMSECTSETKRESIMIQVRDALKVENKISNTNLEVFKVDRSSIVPVAPTEQPAELKLLGLSVYDQETLEQGILQQVDKALECQKQEQAKKQLEKDIQSVGYDIISCEQHLKKSRTLLKALVSIGNAGDRQGSAVRKDIDVRQNQLQTLRVREQTLLQKKSKLFATTNHEEAPGTLSQYDNEDVEAGTTEQLLEEQEGDKEKLELEETDRERKIRLGEMTPFGTILGRNKSTDHEGTVLTDFEKYLKNQAKLNQERKKQFKSNIKVNNDVFNEKGVMEPENDSKKQHSPLKKSILMPKKRKKKEKLGTRSSEDFRDQRRSPGKLLSEKTAMSDEDDEGSEYLPSEEEMQEIEAEERGKAIKKKKKIISRACSKKRVPRKTYKIPEDWATDDSDWDYSDEESRAKRRKSSKKEIDDGNGDDYLERLKLWEETKTCDEPSCDQELEGNYKIPKALWNKLYNYQKVGVQWLWELNQQRCGGILGDEMGLGKTIQVIAFLAGLAHSNLMARQGGHRGLGPSLIIAPTTVMHQWVREFHVWWPRLRIAVLHESGSFTGKRDLLIRQISSTGGVLVTSYVGVVQHSDALIAKNWHYVILDEGHKIRNPDAQVTLTVKQFRTPHRLILSGSPMQNSLKELWSLFDFIFPGKLGTLPVFLAQLAVPITQGGYSNASQVQVATAYRCAMVLRDTIAPYLLRRMKMDVQSHIKLPPKNEQVLFCRLTEEQRSYYRAYLDSGEVDRILHGQTKIFLGLINLRKICNHPDLYSGGPKLFRGDKEEDIPELQRYGHWQKSGKMIVVESLLKIWKKQGHRVLLFTQSRQMLCIMEDFVQKQGYSYLKLDGGTSISARQPLINKFNQVPSYFVFLLTTRVGGLGVNLTGADRVVIFDPDWNPATDTQARERAWRIGQKNRVTVYRLVTAGTIEEKIYHRQIFKQFLTNKVLRDPRQRRFFKSNDLFELFTLKESDQDGSTETAAIFAGTGSEVKVDFKYDKAGARSKKLKLDKSGSNLLAPLNRNVFPESVQSTSEVKFSQSKLDHMRRLAQALSQKITATQECGSVKPEEQCHKDSLNVVKGNVTAVKSSFNSSSEISVTRSGLEQNTSVPECAENALVDESGEITVSVNNLNLESFGTCQLNNSIGIHVGSVLNNCNNNKSPAQISVDIKVDQEVGIESHKLDELNRYNVDIKNDKSVGDSSKTEMYPRQTLVIDNNLKSNIVSSKDQHCVKTKKLVQERKKLKERGQFLSEDGHSKKKSKYKNKKKKRKRKKDCLFEGEKVPHLVGQDMAKASAQLDEERQVQQDEYVLMKLFKKSGLQTALRHDTIMEGGEADYALVEGEAQRVAQEAVKALKESRRQCFQADTGVPSWTGQKGALRNIRFGKKNKSINTNKACASSSVSKHTEQPSSSKCLGIFNRKLKLNCESSDPSEEVMSSGELLTRIRERNRLLSDPRRETEEASSELGTSVNPPTDTTVVPQDNVELLTDIRNFVAFGASVDGRATTQEILIKFKERLPVRSSPLFKFLLQEVCDFHRTPSGEGIWKLQTEFRW